MTNFLDITDEDSKQLLLQVNNSNVEKIISEYVELCKPSSVKILGGEENYQEFVKQQSLSLGEEEKLLLEGHTAHFDGFYDQGRDKEKTRVLVEKGQKLSSAINTGDREECLKEVLELLEGSMQGKTMYVAFYSLGPTNSKFSQRCLQITDSAYVVHSANLLYRQGFDAFVNLAGSDNFFHFVHSAGELENGISKFPDKKRIYIDVPGSRVFSVNVQYAGNSVGLKKLALRLSVHKATEEQWLCEHMFIMGVHSKQDKVNYFAGAFPSASGKTTTAMTPGHTIISDDISYFRQGDNGDMRGVNAEQGIFGILEGVNEVDDPVIYKTLTTPRELIFSNVLVNDQKPYWLGMGGETPKKGKNFSGTWQEGAVDGEGKEIPLAHKNARYTLRLLELENLDQNWNSPEGVPISAILYGGRDPEIMPVIVQSLSWEHGVLFGASIESETTAATIGKIGQKKHDPMANVDFVSVPLGRYINNHLNFGSKLNKPPVIFAVNYFLKKDGKLVGEKRDTKVWLSWMAGRVNGEFEAVETPIGFVPKYEDLAKLFLDLCNKEYSIELYNFQFEIRVQKLLEKFARVSEYYKAEEGTEKINSLILDQLNRLGGVQL